MNRKIKSIKSSMAVWLTLIIVILIVFPAIICAQEITVGLSTTSDPNLFDNNNPLSEEVIQAGLELSKDWDLNNSYLGLYYSGSYSFYEELSTRNNHLHMAMLGFTHHYKKEDSESEENGNDSTSEMTDSTETDEESQDSASTETSEHSLDNSSETVQSDSLDQYLYLTAIGMTQFNKIDFENQDNTYFAGSAIFRQPLGIFASIRPAYTFSYHLYPDLTVLTNYQNIFSLQLTTDFLPGNCFSIIPFYSMKNYPITQSTSDTVYIIKPGKGKKGGNVSTKILSYNFNTPSVRQFFYSFLWKYRPAPGTEFTTQFTRYNKPSKVARVIPELKRGIEKFMVQLLGEFPFQNEIYDDHFSYSGSELSVHAEQLMPFDAILIASFIYQNKTYTYPAKDLSDTVIVADNRIDTRTEFGLNLSRSFSVGKDKSLKGIFEYHYIRNKTNAVFFDFKKSTYMVGLEFSF